MKDKKKVIEYLVQKYGIESVRVKGYIQKRYPATLNNRIRKALEHRDLFYDEKTEDIERKYRDYQKWVFEFIQKNGLEDKYKKECLKELII